MMIEQNKYNKMMEKVKMTPEMRERIIDNVRIQTVMMQQHKKKKSKFILKYQKYMYAAATFLVLLAGIITAQYTVNRNPSENPILSSNNGSNTGSFGLNEYDSLAELKTAIPFTFKSVTSVPFELKDTTYSSFSNTLVQIDYIGATNQLNLRTSPNKEELIGDYNTYSQIDEIEINDITTTIKGNDGSYTTITWKQDGLYYSLQFDQGISKQQILQTFRSMQ
ncbi:hypothetical protein [Paenibacillus sp. WLX2291]|uniref:hypothetical protein n=1 Tax=Paenibacillus sp. WLX2291 TaxID=3296934 RepID=UPI0039843AD5